MARLDLGLAALVLASAVLHATWNALTKSSDERELVFAGMLATCAVVGGVASLFLPAPAPASLPFLGAAAAFQVLYQVFLLRAYRHGDLSHVYPIARGTAPLLVALLAAIFAGEVPRPLQLAGLAIASLAMASFAFETRPTGEGRPVLSAFLAATMIGVYTFLDGEGIRRAGNTWSYIAWNSWVASLPFLCFTAYRARARLVPFLRRRALRSIATGLLATIGYAVVLYALSRGAMASVAALRETSVVFAALLGAFVLREGNPRRRILAALAVAVGVALLELG